MAKILVAEDSQTQAVQIRYMLEEAGHTVQLAKDGEEALSMATATPPDIVLTDMHMPKKTGLELTEAVRAAFPNVPVVLMTADGTAELANEALKKGAASYIPKSQLQQDLIPTLGEIASILESRSTHENVTNAITHTESTYVFGNNHEFVARLVAHFESQLREVECDDETSIFRIALALKEAISNAIDHGNLELDSALRDEDDGSYFTLGANRRVQEPYRRRKVTVTSRMTPEELSFTVADQGPGFDPSQLPDPEDPENLLRAHGRGLLLIRSFIDEVTFNETGNQITMIKYRNAEKSTQA